MAEGPVLYRSGRALDSLGGGTLYPVSCATLYGTQEGVRIRQMAHVFSSSNGLDVSQMAWASSSPTPPSRASVRNTREDLAWRDRRAL